LKSGDKSITIGNQTVMVGGDVITAFNGTAVTSLLDLRAALAKAAPGDQVVVSVLRNSATEDVNVTLAAAQ
jgi:S1-C subfamily serine protease